MSDTVSTSATNLVPDVSYAGPTPDSVVDDRDVVTTARELTIAQFVKRVFDQNEQFAVREGFHDQMRESWRVARSELSDDEKRKASECGLPNDMFEPVTEVRQFAALSQLKEIFSQSGQFPCKLASTAHPDVPKFITEKALKKIIDELNEVVQATGMVPTEEQAAQFGRERIAEILNAEREHSRDEVELLERRVRDDFEEADFLDAFNAGMEYLTVYGTSLWEGPVPCVRMKNEYGGKDGTNISRVAKRSVAFRAVNPLDVYPAPDQVGVDDGQICIKVRYSPDALWMNAKDVAGGDDAENGVWFRDTVSDLLAKYPTGGLRLSWQDNDDKTREMKGQSNWVSDSSCLMEGISYYGQVKGDMLIRMGVLKTHDGKTISSDDFYDVNALVFDEYCVYCRIINPCLGRPLAKAQFYVAPDSFFGKSIAQRLIAHQRILNGCLKSLVVNMNMTCAPIIWVEDTSRLLDKSANALKMYGGKVVAFKSNGIAGVAVHHGPPIGVLRVDSRVNEILEVMNATLKRVDDVSGIPSYTYGQNVTGGAGRTYSGLAMLTEAANRVMKMIIDTLDRNVIRRMVKIDAYRLMLYDKSIGYTGDVEVNPIGAMGLILKQQEMNKVLQLMQLVAGSPVLLKQLPPRGIMELFRQVLETYDIANVDKIIPSKADLDLQEYVSKLAMAAQGSQAAQGELPEEENPQGGPAQLSEPRAEGYERGGQEYRMPREPMPGSAAERRGVA